MPLEDAHLPPDYERPQTPESIDTDSVPCTSRNVQYMETSSLNRNIVPETSAEPSPAAPIVSMFGGDCVKTTCRS